MATIQTISSKLKKELDNKLKEKYQFRIHGFKIQRADGLFSTGGAYPSFSVNGKTWNNIGALRSHFTAVGKQMKRYDNCKVVLLGVRVAIEIKEILPIEIYIAEQLG